MVVDGNVITVGSDIRIATTDAIVNPAVSAEASVAAVVWVGRIVGLEKGGDSACLIAWDRVDVGKSAAGGVGDTVWLAKGIDDCAFGFEDGSPGVDFGSADIGEIGAAEWVGQRWFLE